MAYRYIGLGADHRYRVVSPGGTALLPFRHGCRAARLRRARRFFQSPTAAAAATASPSTPAAGAVLRTRTATGVSFRPLHRTFLRRRLLALEKPASATPHGVAARTFPPASSGRVHFSVGVRGTCLDRAGLRHARRVRLLCLFLLRAKKIQVPVAVVSRWPVRYVVPYLCPLARPLRAPYRRGHRTVHRFVCRACSRTASRSPLTRRSGFSVSLRRGPDSSSVCSSLFSLLYALRRVRVTPDAPMVQSTANARLTGTPVPFHRQITTGCCRKDLSPIGGTGVFRGHTENHTEIQRFPGPRDWPGPGAVALWSSAQCNVLRGDVKLLPAQAITPY